MQIIKLDAIDSTNDFLKQLSATKTIKNFTVVTAKSQTKGKGQMGSKWESEYDKNLIISILINNFIDDVHEIFNINILVSLAVIKALETEKIPKLSIKWPNDIMADNKKIGGILIENIIKTDKKITSIIGIGLNVNQIYFENLPQASSIALILEKNVNRDGILENIINNLKSLINKISNQDFHLLGNQYKNYLYKFGVPCVFENTANQKFMGIIQDVSQDGKLCVLMEDDTVKEFNIKEIKMIF